MAPCRAVNITPVARLEQFECGVWRDRVLWFRSKRLSGKRWVECHASSTDRGNAKDVTPRVRGGVLEPHLIHPRYLLDATAPTPQLPRLVVSETHQRPWIANENGDGTHLIEKTKPQSERRNGPKWQRGAGGHRVDRTDGHRRVALSQNVLPPYKVRNDLPEMEKRERSPLTNGRSDRQPELPAVSDSGRVNFGVSCQIAAVFRRKLVLSTYVDASRASTYSRTFRPPYPLPDCRPLFMSRVAAAQPFEHL